MLKVYFLILQVSNFRAVKDAEANNMLKFADENAKRIIKGLVNSSDEYKEYNVLFEYLEEK